MSNDLFIDISKISLGSFDSNSCYIELDVHQCILRWLFLLYVAFNSAKRYWDCKLPCIEAQIELSSTFVYDQKMSTSNSSTRN